MTIRQTSFTFTSLALASLLAACGGGGGDDTTPSITVPTGARVVAASAGSSLTSDNYAGLSAPLVRAVASATSSSDLVGGASASREQAAAAAGGANVAVSPALLTRLASRLIGAAPLRVQAQATESGSLPCLSGSGTVFADDADNNGQLSAGDVVSFTGNACVLAQGLPAISGTFSMQMEAVVLVGADTPSAFQVLVSTTSFGAGGYGTMSGQSRLWATGLEGSNPVMRISHLSTVVTQAGISVPYLLDVYASISGGVSSYEVSGGLTVNGQTYAVERVNAFVNTPPTVGAVRMLDATGNSATLTAHTNGTSFTMQYALTGTTGAGQPSFIGLWSSYSSNAF